MHPIADILSSAATTAPESFALLSPDRQPLSYGHLWQQTQNLLGQFRTMGIDQTDRVAIVLPSGPEMASSFVGIACACAAAPLNPNYTYDEFRFYLSDLSAKAVVVSESSPGSASKAARDLGISVLTIQALEQAGAFAIHPEVVPASDGCWPSPEDTALLLHTSGTTSRPKLVPLSATNLAISARNIAGTLRLSPADRCLNIMPLFHIHGIAASLLATLASGGSVVCTNGLYGQYFFSWLEEFQPTWYTAVPTMHQALLARARELEPAARRVQLRFVRSSSAPLPPSVLKGIEEAFGAPMIEAYGMTEASHQIASNPLPPAPRKIGSVGLAAGPQVAVMDHAGLLLSPGHTGEIVIRGENVTSGYVGNAAANQAAFTNGWLRTGDQGYLDQDGYLYLTGRLKEIINRGGEKVSPREIDEVLLTHPQVQQALAFAVPHAQLGEEIGAVVELAPSAVTLDPESLRRYVAERLPSFKVPRILRIVPSIPKGPTGKLQRIGLAKQLGIEKIDDRELGDYEVPRPGTEQRVAELWRSLLPGARCGRNDRFEALGGDSLMAATMLTALAGSESVDIPFEAFAAEGTIAALAGAIDGRRKTANGMFRILRESGAGDSLFCFPGHDGQLLGLTRMAQHLDPRISVYGLDFAHCDPQESIENHATRCAAEILRIAPHGPFRLMGVCFGGCLAYAVAECLQRQGHHVENLALIDTLNPAWAHEQTLGARLSAALRQWAYKLRHHGAHLRDIGPLYGVIYLVDRVAALAHYRAETAAAHLALPVANTGYRRAMLNYQPSPLAANALLVRFHGRRLDAPDLGWEGLLAHGYDLVDLPLEPRGALAGESAIRVAQVLNERLFRFPQLPNDTKG